MMPKPILLSLIFFAISFTATAQTGCLVLNYDSPDYSKVFNAVSSGTVYKTGNGVNFVLYEGVCGPHTYVSISGSSQGTCTLLGDSMHTGQIYTVSQTFQAPCGVPIDDYVVFLLLPVSLIGVWSFKKQSFSFSKQLIKS
ncbi:hypothetical protein [Pedobacter roseus]|uniref:Uncharacterized protein n=1 Tax=Pedobacter roseus TaxID=336820 RepID=A0A7G9QI70_9SPHI|nr:hypothetical protein [Pedobacter roseus]QNN43045.1 hypothetical protein H9L23_02760 [Pedobacter roseus]